MAKRLFCFCFFSFFTLFTRFTLFADSLELKDSHFYFDSQDVVLDLQPLTALDIGDNWTSKSSPILIIERLYEINKKELCTKDIKTQDLSCALRCFSKMQGIEYYSTRRKKDCVLYPRAFSFDGKNKKKPILDNTQENADGLVLFFFQEDNSLGECYYQADFLQNQTEVCALMKNIQNIKIGPITAVKKGELCIKVLAQDAGDKINLYMLFRAKFPNISFLSNRLQSSFSSRVESIYQWFIMQLKDL